MWTPVCGGWGEAHYRGIKHDSHNSTTLETAKIYIAYKFIIV